jgi:5-formyltetrahydrofolate cyclo-ligase
MYFVSFGSEVDTRPMVEETIRRGKTALAPKAVPQSRELIPSCILDWESDLMPGYYNIPEPRAGALRPYAPEQIDLLIVPGVAFDLKGNRLGYGGGYYDRFFSLLKPGTPLVALVFELQIVPEVPIDEWDRPVDFVITDQRMIEIKPL